MARLSCWLAGWLGLGAAAVTLVEALCSAGVIAAKLVAIFLLP